MGHFKEPTALLQKSRGISPVLAACLISDALITRIPADVEPLSGNTALYTVIINSIIIIVIAIAIIAIIIVIIVIIIIIIIIIIIKLVFKMSGLRAVHEFRKEITYTKVFLALSEEAIDLRVVGEVFDLHLSIFINPLLHQFSSSVRL